MRDCIKQRQKCLGVQQFKHENCCEEKQQKMYRIFLTTTTTKTTTAHDINKDTGKMHATKIIKTIQICNCYYCCCLCLLLHRRPTPKRTRKNKSLQLLPYLPYNLHCGLVLRGHFALNNIESFRFYLYLSKTKSFDDSLIDGKYYVAIRKIRIMTSHAAQFEKLLNNKAAPMCLFGLFCINIASAAKQHNNCLLLFLRRLLRSKALALNMQNITYNITLIKFLTDKIKLMNKCTKYHKAHKYHVNHQYIITSRNKSFNILSSHVHSNTPQEDQQQKQQLSKSIKTTKHTLNIFNAVKMASVKWLLFKAENHNKRKSSLPSLSTLATCNQNNGADNSSNKCNNNTNNNNNTSLICSNGTNFRAFKSKPKSAATAAKVGEEGKEEEAKTNNKKEKCFSKNNWKVAAFRPLCSFILFIEKQTRKERNVLTNIFYRTTTTNIIFKCNNHHNNNNNNKDNNNNIKQNIFTNNSNNNNNYNINSGRQPSPEFQRLISQRDDDTSNYNRENCRFFKHSNIKLNNLNINNKNKHNLNNNCNNLNIKQQKYQQHQQQLNNNNNKKKHIYENFNSIKVNDVDSKNTNYLSQFQKQKPQTELQTVVNQQKHYSTKKLDEENNLHITTTRQQRNIPLSSYCRQRRRQQLNNVPQKLRNFLMNNLTTTYLKYFYILLTFVCFTTTTTIAPASATTAETFPNTFMNSLNAIKTKVATNTIPSVRLANNEIVCRSLDLRNEPSDFRQLENCTVIEGFLLISLVNTQQAKTEFTETYPLLTEVSEFILVYRVNNLRSLAQIFPNLRVIRGRELFEGYALIVYNNPQLEELGLSELIAISRGAVRIQENFALCFVHTVNWEAITNSTENVIRKNRPHLECPLCPGDHKELDLSMENELACKKNILTGQRNCWNSINCQKICPSQCHDNCIDENTCCNEACIGGCLSTDPNICNSCRNFSIDNSTCIDKCPPTYFNYVDRRCITAANCAGIATKYENNKPETLIAYNGNCTTKCPPGYAKVNATCEQCGDNCIKHCEGGLIDSVSHAKGMNGCTHIINEGLTISIKRGGRFLMEDLEYGLSSIKVIDKFLKVHLTYGIYSLEFFKSLEIIKGEILYENRYSLYVLENSDLEHIWAPNQQVRLENGRVFFHFNPKLCFSEIEKLLPMMKQNSTFEDSEVAKDSNGSKGSCKTKMLNTTVIGLTSQAATINITNPLKFEDDRTFIGYIYYHIEDKYGNATMHGYRPCEDGWTPSDPTKATTTLITGLAPYTQYAYYVKTMTISTETLNAQSNIAHFKTKSGRPMQVSYLNAYANSSSEIVLQWSPPHKVNGILKKYIIRAVMSFPMQSPQTESINYCKTPQPNTPDLGREYDYDVKPTTENPQNAENCPCAPGQNTGSKHRSDETDTPTISESMSFENAIQNFVYVKHRNTTSTKSEETKSNRRKRRRRNAVEDEMGTYDSYLLRHVRSLSNHTEEPALYTSLNHSKLDKTETYYEVVVDSVNENTTQYVFTKLKHFTTYFLTVQACREPEDNELVHECSFEKAKQMRTLKLDTVDKVKDLRANLETSNNTRSVVRLRWLSPDSPNGLVVSYTIAYQLMTEDAFEEKKCITEQDYRKLVDGYVLHSLPIGKHIIRVRSNTQAGEGIFSDPVYVDIPPTRISNTVIAIIVVTILLFLSMIGGFLYYLRKRLLTTPSDLKMFPSVNPYYISLQYIPDDWEVSRERVIQLSPLGQGSFGMVYEGILKGLNEDDQDQSCAVKTVNENATDRERMNFLNEASVMKQFDTYHVVRLLGVCSRGQPALVIMELMKNGDLKSYLRAHRPDEREDGINGYMLPQHEQLATSVGGGGTLFQPPPLSRLYQMALEIADGMAYLSAKKFVHRDLAARNCMVAADLTVKIGDFGMTRDIYETDYYRKGTKGLLPVRWMPPESLRDGVYSSASDVFSYGVVLWEMATLASQPYQGLSNDQVLRYVIDGGVMERPENCPDKLYSLMQKCWHHRPSARPTFMDIITHLSDFAHPTFHQVSFYYSDEGEQIRQKELAEKMKHSDDVFTDREIEIDDVTTPLRVGEYNSSIENHDGSPIGMEDEPQHSAYSLGSDINASSTPDGNLHGGGLNLQSYTPKIQPVHEGRTTTNPIDIVIQKSMENEERGYEVYDPSPQYQHDGLNDDDHHRHLDGHDDDDDGSAGGDYGSTSVDARMLGERLLPRKKRNQRGRSGIIIKQISNSVPDEVGGITISSSLHPSTASAASSNASSTTTATGKYPSLKKTVADTMHNVGHNLRHINKRLFSHKRNGSTGSHKSINMQPTIAGSSTSSHITPSTPMIDMIAVQQQQSQPQQQQHLATIESGGSGSGGSYCISPRFFTPAAGPSDNPNYQPYDVAKIAETTANEGANVNYQLMGGGGDGLFDGSRRDLEATENPNYEIMQPPLVTSKSQQNRPLNELLDIKNVHISENPNYQATGPPATKEQQEREAFQNIKITSSSASLTSSETEMTADLNKKKTSTTKKQRNRKNRTKQKQPQQQQKLEIEEANVTPIKIQELTPLSQIIEPATTTATSMPLSRFSLKEKWLRQQQEQQQQRPQQSNLSSPPNGFIG